MVRASHTNKQKILLGLSAAGIFLAVMASGLLVQQQLASLRQPPFPEIERTGLSDTQKDILTVLKREYDAQPTGLKYTQGLYQPWCADFASYVFREVGRSYVNPDNGDWRIPEIAPLHEYYESEGRFRAAGTGYTPSVGDIMIYDHPNPFGRHTNIVIKVEGDTVTTVGGTEPDHIEVDTHRAHHFEGFVGYGTLD